MNLNYDPIKEILSGVLLQCDQLTSSNIIYPKTEVITALDVYSDKIKNNMAFGTFARHPTLSQQLNMGDVAVLLIDAFFDDNTLKGTFRILKTEPGKSLTQMLQCKIPTRASLCSTGILTKQIVTDLKIVAFNITT
jgi:hypothetical protein